MPPIRPCPKCSLLNSPSNRFCAQCGDALPTKFFTPGVIVLFVGLGLLVVVGAAMSMAGITKPRPFGATDHRSSALTTPSPSPTATPVPTPTPAADILTTAKGLTGEDASRESLGRAVDMLRTIPKGTKEYKEAQPLLDKTTKRWARLAAEELVLGPKPDNKGWNGTVFCVDQYLKNTLNDYDSSEYLEWSPVTRVDMKGEPYWAVRLKLRAKNGFNAYMVKDVIFLIRQNQVVRAVGL